MHILKNLKWLFNHPPTNITCKPNKACCKYCGVERGVVTLNNREDGVCWNCVFDAIDRVLKDKGEKVSEPAIPGD